MFKLIEKAGVVPLAWGEWLPPAVELKREIKRPEDMKGMKLRVVGSPLYIDTFTALGANPTQMSWADAQPALASGAVDGQENPLSIYTGSKLYTVGQKYLTLWNYVADPLIFVVNREVWNAWSEKDREIVRQAALDAGKQQIVIARKGVTPEDPSLLKGNRRPRRHRDLAVPGRPRRLRQDHQAGLRKVEEADRRGSGQHRREGDRGPQEVKIRKHTARI